MNHPIDVIKNTRVESREDQRGRIRERTVTTWDVVENGRLLGQHDRQRDALAARYKLWVGREGAK